MSGIYSVVSVIVGVSAVISFAYGLWVLDNESCQSEMREYVLASTIMFPTYLALSVLFVIAKVYANHIPTAVMGVVKFLFDFFIIIGTFITFAVLVWGTYLLPTDIQCLDSAIFSSAVFYVIVGWLSLMRTVFDMATSDRFKYSSESWFDSP